MKKSPFWSKHTSKTIKEYLKQMQVGDKFTVLVEDDGIMLPIKAEGGMILRLGGKMITFIPMRRLA